MRSVKISAFVMVFVTMLCGVGFTNDVQNTKYDTLTITVDYDRSISDYVNDGQYNSVLWILSGRFCGHWERSTDSGKTEVEVILVNFDEPLSTQNVLDTLTSNGLRPANLQELLAIGEQYPEKQRACSLVALGSTIETMGIQYSPSLVHADSLRVLTVYWIDDDWAPVFHFVAVRK